MTEEQTAECFTHKKGISVFIAIALGVIVILLSSILIYKEVTKNNLSVLPKPEVAEGMRGELGIDKNINETNIDNYLNRPDAVYRDMRLMVDEANYEAIGGDRYLSGIVDGFEVVSLPYIIEPKNLPELVGNSYKGETLFSEKAGEIIANYKESKQILEDLFPKDKIIFLMCGGGGYAGMTKDLLVKLGWDADKIYNVGGYWYYEGDNKVEIKDGDTYAFWKLNYHLIDFKNLKKTNK